MMSVNAKQPYTPGLEPNYSPELPPVLQNAVVVQSDYKSVRRVVAIWAFIMNTTVFECRPILFVFSLFSKSHQDYKKEIEAIETQLTAGARRNMAERTTVYGGETHEAYQELCKTFDRTVGNRFSQTQIIWSNREHSDSLGAAQEFIESEGIPASDVAIVSFANGVRVGGADSVGGKGSQEENLLRRTYLRVSLEHAYKISDPKIREATGRYIPYYGAVASLDIPTIDNPNQKFNYISSAAPDNRTGVRSEGTYLKELDPDTRKEILRRKLTVVMISAALARCGTLVLGAYGAGAFGNEAKEVAEVTNELLESKRFKGVFSHIIMPIGTRDPNQSKFKAVFHPRSKL